MTSRVAISFVLFFLLFSHPGVRAQSANELKKQKKLEKEKKLKQTKRRAAQKVFVLGYSGGTMAPLGVNWYTMNPKNVGFYASLRGLIEQNTPYKGLNLNIGITKNLFFPVGMYIAAGVSDYALRKPDPGTYGQPVGWEMGVDASMGLIFHIKGIELQGGISLFNFSRPELCFGIGINSLRQKQ